MPGCVPGGPGDTPTHDYCYQPGSLVDRGASGCSSSRPCPICHGDCDNDAQCASGLKCFQRQRGEQVPGCVPGGPGDTPTHDYCYQPGSLVDRGASGCSSSRPCPICHGDCDNDAQCASGLKCFQRQRGEQVPGCVPGGPGDTPTHDYCYQPGSLVDRGASGCSSSRPCPICHGDCDNDAQCALGLKCFQRQRSEQVPGCVPGGPGDTPTHDYCYQPGSLVDRGASGCSSSRPCPICHGDCDNDAQCASGLKCFQRQRGEQVPGCVPGGPGDTPTHDYCYQPGSLVDRSASGCSSSRPCPICHGDCDNDAQCASGLKCFQRQRGEQVPGCVPGGPGDTPTHDYCYQPGSLVDRGASGCSSSRPCPICHGDCDNDAQCASGLKCFQRQRGEQVPGCVPGGPGDTPTHDYCYQPGSLVDRGASGCSSSRPCPICHGDCDNDAQCALGLKCFQRQRSEQVPGCVPGGPGDTPTHDYCYQPGSLVDRGASGCSSSRPCPICHGDCDNDAQCASGLKCFQRQRGEQVPGCVPGGPGDTPTHDYCYKPG